MLIVNELTKIRNREKEREKERLQDQRSSIFGAI
jgi:hypothetical protein